MKEVFKILNIKETFFINGWSKFDALSLTEILSCIPKDCKFSGGATLKIITALLAYPDLMCFGQISENGEIMLEGITGFPSNDVCVKYLKDLAQSAKKYKIDDNYVFIEW
jgi:hypothetical protein